MTAYFIKNRLTKSGILTLLNLNCLLSKSIFRILHLKLKRRFLSLLVTMSIAF